MKQIFDKIPDVSFIDNMSLSDLQEEMVKAYQEKYQELSGQSGYVLPKASPYRIILNAVTLQLYQGWMFLDQMGKMNLLKYARDEFLDNYGARFGILRKPGEAAKTTLKFSLPAPRTSTIIIPEGVRCTNGNVYFKTAKMVEIPAGSTEIEVDAVCSEVGTVGNGFLPGEINTLVDSVPYITAVNTTTTQYGTDRESDDDLRERIFLAPSSFSVAGPEDAYIYFAKEYSSLIADVKVTNPSPRVVDIRVILKDGTMPDAAFCTGLEKYLSQSTKRPLTDTVRVEAPQKQAYTINVKYFISDSDKANSTSIQKSVEEAVEAYKIWQDTKIGRDINPSQLIRMMTNAGAKRVEVTAPAYQATVDTKIPNASGTVVNFGGIEDD